MKKVLMTLVALVAFTIGAVAQDGIGLRLGTGSAFNAEVSYQKMLSQRNRLELDLGGDIALAPGLNYNHYSGLLTGAYHWRFNIIENFGWFVGPAAGIGFWTEYYRNNPELNHSAFNLNIGAQGGVEYYFNGIPLMVSLDSRPMIDVLGFGKDYNHYNPFSWGVCASVRYTF